MIDIFGLLEQKGYEVKQNSSDPDEFRICCPFCSSRGHSDDDEYKCGFNIRNGLGHCFKCKWSSRSALLTIIHWLTGVKPHWSEVSAVPFTHKTRTAPEPPKFPPDWTLLKDVDDWDPWWGPPRRYIMRRGVTQRQLRIHEIGATREHGKMDRRVVFPVRDEKGKLAGFVGRDWTGEVAKQYRFMNSIGNKVAYNIRLDYPMKRKMVIVCEGIVKALALERATDFQICCAASLGGSSTDIQMAQYKLFDEVVLFPDPDVPGMSGYIGTIRKLTPLTKRVTMIWPWPRKQADEMTTEKILTYLENRRIITDKLVAVLREQIERRTEEQA